jgi:uncharacterized protein (TIGR00661 family)
MRLSSDITILIAPLNWGLGHAARCIPLIHHFTNQGCRVVLCGNGDSFKMLTNEFKGLTHETLPDYSIRYSKNPRWFAFKMLFHLPKFFSSVRKDMIAAQLICEKYHPQLIISDNRYGFRNHHVISVLITHQTQPVLPDSLKAFSKMVWKKLEKKMNAFDEIWIPDFESEPSLSGILSHNNTIHKKKTFIGPLSRFSKMIPANSPDTIVAIASGPEPHRSKFENMVVSLSEKTGQHFTLVQGNPGKENYFQSENLTCYNHLNTAEFESLLKKCTVVLTRAGYSSIMDLVAMGKKAILVPTPGQTEQIYLSKHLSNHELFSIYNPENDDFETIYKELINRKVKNNESITPIDFNHFTNTLLKFSDKMTECHHD